MSAVAVAPEAALTTGLSSAEVAQRQASGLSNRTGERASRTVGEILRANVFTRFNALLGALWVLMVVIGPIQDAFFGLIILANTAIGTIQELRAKITLDRLALLHAPTAQVLRDGRLQAVPAVELVPDDLLRVVDGEEVPADAGVLQADGLEVNEALLTGESAPVKKARGDELLAGSFVVSGSAFCQVTRVGDDTFAGRVTRQAKQFQLVRSDLMVGINRILRLVTWLIGPMAIMLLITQLRANSSLQDALRSAVAGLVPLIPQGVVLFTSLVLAVAIVKLGRHAVLVQQLAAVEMLARADLVCFDKTGTLTDGTMRLERLEPLDGRPDAQIALAALVRLDDGDELKEVAAALPPSPWRLIERVPFSSARRWSAARFAESGAWVLGAPETLLPAGGVAAQLAEQIAGTGRRVLLLGRLPEPADLQELRSVSPVALVVLREGIRPQVREILDRLGEEGVGLAVLSGDHPATVTALAAALGISPETGAEIHGRLSPEDKARLVSGYRQAGRTVAMVGDGVNDVLALKAADIGIAIGGGSTAARAVAPVVLLNADFSSVPAVIAEGRRVIANVERLASLFMTETVYVALLGVGAATLLLPFPFLPRNLTLVSAFTIGLPAFFLAMAPTAERARPGFLGRVARFSVPAGLVAAAFTFAGYYLALDDPRVQLDQARTVATIVLSGTGIWILSLLARPLTTMRKLLIAAMAAALTVGLLLPISQSIFGIDLPHALACLAAVGLIALSGATLELGVWLSGWASRVTDSLGRDRGRLRRA